MRGQAPGGGGGQGVKTFRLLAHEKMLVCQWPNPQPRLRVSDLTCSTNTSPQNEDPHSEHLRKDPPRGNY